MQGRTGGGGEDKPVMVEISPGVHVKLRRTKDTLDAIANDFYLPVTCFACAMDLFAIANVLYVVCPMCTVVSPVEGGEENCGEGLGLGFTLETLKRVQCEIMEKRQKEEKDYGKQKYYKYHQQQW